MVNASAVTLRAISGVGGKGSACFLPETAGERIMLDLDYGPDPGVWPKADDVGKVDALILSKAPASVAMGATVSL